MTLAMFLVIISIFLFSLWFKRSEIISRCDVHEGVQSCEKLHWGKSLKFAFLMTLVVSLQWVVLKIILLS